VLKAGVGALGALSLGAVGCRGKAVPPPDVTAGQFFTDTEMRILADVVDQMIPETSTPGALSAGVHTWLDGMMTNWASGETKASLRRVVASYDDTAFEHFSAAYVELDREGRFSIATRVDELGFTQADETYRSLKSLIYHGYKTSREANPDYLSVPGEYRGCLGREDYEALSSR
jgi:hypothetical protein